MIKGKVIGSVWATRKVDQLDDRKLLLVAELDGEGRETDHVVVCYDDLDAGTGDIVTVSFGSGARNTVCPPPNRHILCDAAVSMIIEGESRSDGRS